MPLIEELPNTSTTTRPSHGWTYVPDTGPSTIPLPAVPLGSRKRGRDGPGGTTSSSTAQSQAFARKLSAKQEKAIQQRLIDLAKENYRDVNIPVPKRDGGRGGGRKPTQNVRRILAYSRTFQHYLADEEAGVNVYGSAALGPLNNTTQGVNVNVNGDSRRRGGATTTATEKDKDKEKTPRKRGSQIQTSSTTAKNTSTTQQPPSLVKTEKQDVDMHDAPASGSVLQNEQLPSTSQVQLQNQSAQQEQTGDSTSTPYDPALDRDPLLRTRDIPKMPSDRVMQVLLSEPPLSYTAARAKPLEQQTEVSPMRGGGGSGGSLARPQRWFCAVCGYWGKVRCS